MANHRFLLIHPGGIGDVLLALPAIRSLHRRYGVDQSALVVIRSIGELLIHCHEIGRLFPLEGQALSGVWGGAIQPGSVLEEWLLACDVVIGWMADPDGSLSRNLSERGVRQIIIRSPLTERLSSVHQSDRILETLRDLKLDSAGECRLKVQQIAVLAGRSALRRIGMSGGNPYVVIHPGSGSIHKCCEPALMADMVRWSHGKGFDPVIIGGPADSESVNRMQAHCSRPVPVIQDADLTAIAGVVKEATLYIGHDSGISHLAAALGVPSVVCFGPTDERRWAPRGANVSVVRANLCHCPNWETVQQCSDKPCLAIPVDQLISVCESMSS